MTDSHRTDPILRFERIVRERRHDETMAALIIDSPWMPGFAGVNTLDFYFDVPTWIETYEKTHARFPSVALLPDAWLEFGMATEPSAWGVPIQWTQNFPPSVRHYPGTLQQLASTDPPDPECDGLMPALLRQLDRSAGPLRESGIMPRIAAARGPMAVASHLVGVPELLMATQLEPDRAEKVLENTTTLIIRWLAAQLKRMDEPIGILVLDDIVGMTGPDDAERFSMPMLKRIFDEFPGLLHIFHNDTPNIKVYPNLARVGIDVFNFSDEIDARSARDALGPDMVLMGNVPPLDVLSRGTPEQVRQVTGELLAQLSDCAPLVVSAGGGVSPSTPAENLQAMVETVDGR